MIYIYRDTHYSNENLPSWPTSWTTILSPATAHLTSNARLSSSTSQLSFDWKRTKLNSFQFFDQTSSVQSINLSQFFDSVKFQSGSGSGYHVVIDFCIVMFYMLMILMKFSFIPQTFFGIFFFLRSGSEIHWRKLFFIWVILLQTAHQPQLDILELSKNFFTDNIHKNTWHVFQYFAGKNFLRKYLQLKYGWFAQFLWTSSALNSLSPHF